MPRRFPTPWTAEQTPGGFVVKDATGQALAYVYSRETKDAAHIANVLTEDEARRIAANIVEAANFTRRSVSDRLGSSGGLRPDSVLCVHHHTE